MSGSDATHNFFLRLNEGRESAAEELDQRYRRQLCALVEREMGSRFAAREDPEDAVQSALRSFCRGIQEKRFHIDHAGGLWRLLATITHHKVLKHIEHHTTEGRDPDNEARVEGDVHQAREPSPADVAIATELIEKVVEGLSPPDPEIFRLRLEGCTRTEIAQRFGLTEATVRFKLDRVRDRIRRLLGNDSKS